MNKKYTLDQIEDYIEDRLSTTERTAFEKQLSKDAALQNEVNFYQNLQLATNSLAKKENFRKTIQSVDQELEANSFFQASSVDIGKKKSPKPRSLWIPISIAASFLILLWIGGRQWGKTHYTNEILASNFEPFEIGTVGTRGSTLLENQLQKGIYAFENRSYPDAIQSFLTIPSDHPLYPESTYYLAHTYMIQQNYDAAIDQFRIVVNTESILYNDRAEWYQLRAMLLAERTQPMLNQQLDKILANPNHGYYEQAKQLKQKINSFWRKLY